jgi:hypothetical protein
MMTKLEVQKRILKNDKPLDLDLFSWDEKTNIFSSKVEGLVLDFSDISNCTFKTGSYCTFSTGYSCNFNTGLDCTFNTGSNCVFRTYSNCSFNTGHNCTFHTISKCIFDTGSNCVFNTGYDCTFKTGANCVICRLDTGEIIKPSEGEIIQLLQSGVTGFLSKLENEDKFYLNRDKELGEHIMVDGILSKVISRKDSIYEVINYGENIVSYIIKNEFGAAHGKTIKKAKESLVYKLQYI